jgi:hypothetical protein
MKRNAARHAAKKIGKLPVTTESAPAVAHALLAYWCEISDEGLTTPGNLRKMVGLDQFSN